MNGGITVEEVAGRREKQKSLPFIVRKVCVCVFLYVQCCLYNSFMNVFQVLVLVDFF